MKIFWCPSGARQYDQWWQLSSKIGVGYNQYCSRDNSWRIQLGDARVVADQSYEHSPLKNVPHINGGRTENGQWINYKFNSTWITFTDINFQGMPISPTHTRSNHHKFITRIERGKRARDYGSAGTNALHAGGSVTWHGEEDIKLGSPKSLGCWIKAGLPPAGPGICEKTSYWMFPRTD